MALLKHILIIKANNNRCTVYNDNCKYIIENMKLNKTVTIKEIRFPEHIQIDRTKRKYMASLIIYGLIAGVGYGRSRTYTKIKEM